MRLFLLLLLVFQFSCSKHNKDSNQVIGEGVLGCSDLKNILAIESNELVKDFRNKSSIYLKLNSLGFNKYSFGTNNHLTLKDESLSIPDSLISKVNIYYKFQNEVSGKEVIFYEVMQHVINNKHKSIGLILCYFEEIENFTIENCEIDEYGTVILSEDNSLLVVKN